MATNNFDGTKLDLKYLFKAEFEDGTIIAQGPEDISSIDPERSCFFDVLKAVEEGKKPVKFTLEGQGHVYAVSLIDGHFEVDGIPFFAHEQIDLKDFRIMYFRVRDTHFSQSGGSTPKYLSSDCSYRIGWQANDVRSGENHQQFIEIK